MQGATMRRTAATLTIAAGLLLGATIPAAADPITCPPGQTGTGPGRGDAGSNPAH